MSSATMLAFVGGLEFDIFFRGLLSVLVGVVVLIGGSYLIVATNTGSRTGGLIAFGALFGWMFLMGIVWTVYGIGWVGEAQSWSLEEVSTGDLELAENVDASELGISLGRSNDFFASVSGADADERQRNALEFASENEDRLSGWEYLAASNPRRGDAQSAAEEYLIEENVFDTPNDYIPLQFGGFALGGKPAGVEGDSVLTRFRKKAESILNPFHGQELVAIQVQAVLPQPTLPGQAPPIPVADESADVVTVILERDRGGPVPWLISGTRFVPAAFTIINAILFAIVAYLMHIRDKREMAIRAAAT
ncbi:MAG: hypothetical protein HKN24_02520 [Acidimicrobiales bacterium]|nr:hypothetical protein [Acidimicrobiales bacterium]